MLKLNNVEVVYDRAVLVLRGISLQVPEQRIVTVGASDRRRMAIHLQRQQIISSKTTPAATVGLDKGVP